MRTQKIDLKQAIRIALFGSVLLLSGCGGSDDAPSLPDTEVGGDSGNDSGGDSGNDSGNDSGGDSGTTPPPFGLPEIAGVTFPEPENFSEAQTTALLHRITFGESATSSDLARSDDYRQWLAAQLNAAPSLHLNRYQALESSLPTQESLTCTNLTKSTGNNLREGIWWEALLFSDDQFRQRMAFALSQITVLSKNTATLNKNAQAVAAYYDILVRNAFGNYRDLLKEVTLNPAMGFFLTMVNSRKFDEKRGTYPDENYAREVMQLFSIGLYELNLDGSMKKDAQGQPIYTYSQTDVENVARAFSGWTYSDRQLDENNRPIHGVGLIEPMTEAFDNQGNSYHDADEKIILGTTIPAGQTPAQDVEAVIDILFNHPNIAPFIAKQLIQRLVTSNPSPAYIERVATVFNDNGQGERGNLESVALAIVFDEEALSSTDVTMKKVKEPSIMAAHFFKAVGMQEVQGMILDTNEIFNALGHGPLRAETVFNYYANDFMPSGALMAQNLVAPELEIFQWTGLIAYHNMIHARIERAMFQVINNEPNCAHTVNLDLMPFFEVMGDDGQNIDALLDLVSDKLFRGAMSADLRKILHAGASAEDHRTEVLKRKGFRIRHVLSVAAVSSEFLMQE